MSESRIHHRPVSPEVCTTPSAVAVRPLPGRARPGIRRTVPPGGARTRRAGTPTGCAAIVRWDTPRRRCHATGRNTAGRSNMWPAEVSFRADSPVRRCRTARRRRRQRRGRTCRARRVAAARTWRCSSAAAPDSG